MIEATQGFTPLEDEVTRMVTEVLGPSAASTTEASLIQVLRQSHTMMRVTAASLLRAATADVPLEALRQALHDPEPGVREAATKAMGYWGERAPLALLAEAFNDHEIAVQWAALDAYELLGTFAPTEPLVAALAHPDPRVRRGAAGVLVRLHRPFPLEPLLTDLAHPDRGVQRAAAWALGYYPGPIPLEAIKVAWKLGWCWKKIPLEGLQEFLADPDPQVRRQAANNLDVFGEQIPLEVLLPLLHDPDGGVRQHAVRILGNLSARAPVAALVAALDDTDLGVRVLAAEALGKLGSRAPVETLEAAYARNTGSVREALARALGDLGAPGWASPRLEDKPTAEVVSALSDADHEVRLEAALVLYKRPAGDIPVEPLVATLQDSRNNKDIREAVVHLFGRLEERAPIESLVQALRTDPHHDVRSAAAEALREVNAIAAVDAVVAAAIEDADGEVREDAIWTLSALAEQVPAEVLRSFLGSREQTRRTAAVEALSHHHVAALRPALQEAEAILLGRRSGTILGSILQGSLAETIGELRLATPEAVQHLISLLEWPHWEIQREAALALKKLQAPLPEEAIHLLQTLQVNSPVRPLREATTEALMVLRSPGAERP